MAVFALSLVLMLAAVLAMAVGKLLGRSGIRGGCGSLAGVDGGERCALCTRPCSKRRTGKD
ncbi:MAG: (Na+)-NQR maturation NqrM [Gammaproteobacteria bacterium]